MSRYKDLVKVIKIDLMCFPANPITLEQVGTSVFDPWAITQPEEDPAETLDINEYMSRWSKLQMDKLNSV